ncbi:hypothetical protein [Georgenia subflava]|uniref:Uncharacterized protein n=1 Tax=Georgenia subflava TaxID=1622177 RepID=A0A6N7EGV1_9MICO|nr:hypothetical protein [Georgenia subflava]MPV37592.1 hypothetical protein [Georgenia subflava]
MTPDPTTVSDFDAYWRALATEDRRAHAAESDRALLLEVEGLRARCADLAAALTQARAAIDVRQDLLTAQSAALEERDQALAEAQADYLRVVRSKRWRAFDLLGRAGRRGRSAVPGLRRPA